MLFHGIQVSRILERNLKRFDAAVFNCPSFLPLYPYKKGLPCFPASLLPRLPASPPPRLPASTKISLFVTIVTMQDACISYVCFKSFWIKYL
jgi:hypothetical protein